MTNITRRGALKAVAGGAFVGLCGLVAKAVDAVPKPRVTKGKLVKGVASFHPYGSVDWNERCIAPMSPFSTDCADGIFFTGSDFAWLIDSPIHITT